MPHDLSLIFSLVSAKLSPREVGAILQSAVHIRHGFKLSQPLDLSDWPSAAARGKNSSAAILATAALVPMCGVALDSFDCLTHLNQILLLPR